MESRPEGEHAIQLYSLGTPNGQKISIALEEMGLEYDGHKVNIMNNTQFEDWFVAINPNSKIPAIIDKNGPDGQPINVFESGAILLYLAKKTGKFLPTNERKYWETIQWVFWQMAGFGPMLGQMGHFTKYAKEDVPYGKQRYTKEAQRLFKVLDKQLEDKEYIIGDEYTIADMAIFPWVICVDRFYNQRQNMGEVPNVDRWVAKLQERPAVQKGMAVLGV